MSALIFHDEIKSNFTEVFIFCYFSLCRDVCHHLFKKNYENYNFLFFRIEIIFDNSLIS